MRVCDTAMNLDYTVLIFNNAHQDIRFIYEKEGEKINFLDVQLSKAEDDSKKHVEWTIHSLWKFRSIEAE